jgi:hypothetical protein
MATDDLANFREVLSWSRPIGHGAATPVLFVANPRVEGASGHYDEGCAGAKRIS